MNEIEKRKEKAESICIQCQGIGYNYHNKYYVKCVLCKGELLINKIKIAEILSSNQIPFISKKNSFINSNF